MKCSGTMANLLSTRACEGGSCATVMDGSGFSKGLKGFFLAAPGSAAAGGGPLGLFAREGENRS